MSKKVNKKYNSRRENVIPPFETNPIVDNYTAENGRVYNRSEENIIQAKKEVDANEK